MKNKLPNFLIVGAAKSGTSSLHNYLNQHHQVFMPSYNKEGMKVKEPRFLIKDLVQHRLHNGIWTFEEYQSLFDDVKDEKAIGESTVLYLYYYKHAINNMKKYLSEDVKIIIMLRNPADRAYSAFHHVSRGLKENNSFEKSLEIEKGRMEREENLTPMVMYKEMGMYYEMVKAYTESFKNIHIIFYEDFRDNIQSEMNKIYNYLGVSNNVKMDFIAKHNVGGKKWKNEKMKHVFMKDNPMKSILKSVLPEKFRKGMRNKLINASTNKILSMKEETREYLNDYFKQDVKKLSELLNKDLNHWIK
ncbi:MAG: sulfotransferase domain-containing protein [Flavobacteriales bacterium]|nr:sulfotransferase domain-containing protein [Flavobacteriales bacterium]|tara:strand:- start:7766 stop:8674 length:909 start_codon:yes stop_codon:yes gene_type:complete